MPTDEEVHHLGHPSPPTHFCLPAQVYHNGQAVVIRLNRPASRQPQG
jgi:hypothetical protein